MTWLEIRPKDVWLFRDGKPFSAGEDHSAHSLFPPTPLTTQGALRFKIATSLGVSIDEFRAGGSSNAQQVAALIGPHGPQLRPGALSIAGPFVGWDTGPTRMPLFPAPADLLKPEELEGENARGFAITRPDVTLTSDFGPDRVFPVTEQGYANLPGHWITADLFEDYLSGVAPEPLAFRRGISLGRQCDDSSSIALERRSIVPNAAVYQTENRFGVAIDFAKSFRKEGMLYQAQFVRPQKDICLLVDVRGIPDTRLIEGEIKLGSEQRMASVQAAEVEGFPTPPKQVTGRFKVIFLTPAYFAEGWQPKESAWSNLFGAPVDLVSAALYRSQRIGGWNSAAGRARTMHNFIAPGSVYYFETQSAFQPPAFLTEDPNEITDAAAFGFGQYALAQW